MSSNMDAFTHLILIGSLSIGAIVMTRVLWNLTQ